MRLWWALHLTSWASVSATAACPPSWTASPTGACYRVPEAYSTHSGCAELCSAEAPPGQSASLACVRSDNESRFIASDVATRAVDFTIYWIGHYQWPIDEGVDAGWTQCSNGASDVNFTRWMASEPDISGGFFCAALLSASMWPAGGGGWWCDDGCMSYRKCMCQLGLPTAPSYFEWLATVTAVARLRFCVMIAVLTALAMAPTCTREIRQYMRRTRTSAEDASHDTLLEQKLANAKRSAADVRQRI